MATIDDDLDLDVEGKKGAGGGKMKNIIIFSVIGILLIGISITTTLLIMGGGNKGDETAEKPTTEAKQEHKAVEEHKSGAAAATGANAAYLDLNPPSDLSLGYEKTVPSNPQVHQFFHTSLE